MRPAASASIHGDLDAFCAADTGSMDWTRSPSGTVWRKRVHLVGPAESGQVTSVVRYDSNSSFPQHDHPAGEEILVLEGVFSDQQGDWPAGTYLLNPEGFRHAPFSKNGCVLFVKLRQYPGADRRHVAVDTNILEWQRCDIDGLSVKTLYQQQGYTDTVELQRWETGSDSATMTYPEGAEMFIIEGGFDDESGNYRKGSWLRFPAGASHRLRSGDGCVLYVKKGGLKYLMSAVDSGAL
ncbi:MAG: cupin domain-containing protein [Burkholderiales bacterium]|jgi:anti-sigma factor ChrR (cupin superfamily)